MKNVFDTSCAGVKTWQNSSLASHTPPLKAERVRALHRYRLVSTPRSWRDQSDLFVLKRQCYVLIKWKLSMQRSVACSYSQHSEMASSADRLCMKEIVASAAALLA